MSELKQIVTVNYCGLDEGDQVQKMDEEGGLDPD